MPTREEYDWAERNWGNLSLQEKLDFATRAINDTLLAYGYRAVDVIVANLVDRYGTYVPMRGRGRGYIALDRDHLTNDPFRDVMDTAFHEAAHAMDHQDFEGSQSEDVDAYERDAERFARGSVDDLYASWDYDDPGMDELMEMERDDDYGSAGDDLDAESGSSSSSVGEMEFDLSISTEIILDGGSR